MKATKFFVTGGTGFIGSHLVDKLVGMGEVTVYGNLSSGKKEFIIGVGLEMFLRSDLMWKR